MAIVADSSFHIFFCSEINETSILKKIVQAYEMYYGDAIKNEVLNCISENKDVYNNVENISLDINFKNILSDFYDYLLNQYSQLKNRIDDGEWEAIGISYHLHSIGKMEYLIIDEKYAYNFVISKLPTLRTHIVRTLRFVYSASKKDAKLNQTDAIYIFNRTKEEIRSGKTPLYLTRDIWDARIEPLMARLRLGEN
ncbi:MAG: hypothetical protein KAS32_00985 [Candidatus Peribacteraceae bacterium]|nr:hypothetical protein [Candidatus Peribacteraceae bacterium]